MPLPRPLVVLVNLAQPWVLIGVSLFFAPVTVARALVARDWRTLSSLSRFKDAWFARMWLFGGPIVRAGAWPRVAPLLTGRVQSGAVIPTGADGAPPVRGTVLEVGPGSGMWVHLFSDYANGTPGPRAGITKVYGVEPNTGLHPMLREHVREAGLTGTYEVVPVGIQDIGSVVKLEKGTVDAVVTLMCLCTIPEPDKNIRELYSYLKPGGQWFVYEHVQCGPAQGAFMRTYQSLLNRLWLPLMDGCDLCRNTVASLRAAGSWSHTDIAPVAGEGWWVATPHILGTLTK